MVSRGLVWLAGIGLVAACGADPDNPTPEDPSGSTGEPEVTEDPTDPEPDPTEDPTDPEPEDEDDDSGANPPIYDVHGVGGGYCEDREAGIYCNDGVAYECNEHGSTVSEIECIPSFCEDGVGCLPCLEGQYDCHGPHVMRCDTSVQPHVWERIETCDPAAAQGCDLAMGTCVDLEPIGGTEPTGEYYQYVDFQSADGFMGGYDVDGFMDLLYVTSFSSSVDVYRVDVLDSDGDGAVEPNQHPDNPDEQGPVETRTLEFVESISIGGAILTSQSELLALEDRIFIGGSGITETIFDGGGSTQITTAPSWADSTFAQIGYDQINGVWYAANEGWSSFPADRRVFQQDPATGDWGIAFYYPNLAGDHMDGVEVVPDPNTATPFVYVSDMTSDFIGQYRKDPEDGWVQHNLFEYDGTVGAVVEGMGFGPNLHFWVSSGSGCAEVGGGDLQEFVEPRPTG